MKSDEPINRNLGKDKTFHKFHVLMENMQLHERRNCSAVIVSLLQSLIEPLDILITSYGLQ